MAVEKVYVGERESDEVGRCEVRVDRYEDGKLIGRNALKHIVRHSPGGFEWGYAGSGPADLAHSIIADFLEMKAVSGSLYQAFKFEFIAKFPKPGFELRAAQIQGWLDSRWRAMDHKTIQADLAAN